MTRTKRIISIAAIAAAVILIAGLVVVKIFVLDQTTNAPKAAIPVSAQDRVLIIAPHPDDETLGPGALARQAIDAGAQVKAVIITAGDGSTKAAELNSGTTKPTGQDYLTLGEVRHKESLAAMKIMGVSDVVFLAFADGSTNSLWRVNWDNDNPRLALNGNTSVPYEFAYRRGALYSGESLVDTLSELINEYKPTIIFYPTPEDLHHDHWAVNAFTQYVLAKNNVKSREFTYLVHRGNLWPSPPAYLPKTALKPPAGLAEMDAEWIRYPVNETVRDEKLAAVRSYKSQMRVTGVWLTGFVRTNELFASYPLEKTTQANTAPSFEDTKTLPGVTINDYEASELSKKLAGKGDIKRFAFAYDSKYAYISVDFKDVLPADVITMLNMRFFTPSGVNRVDIRIYEGKAEAVKAAGNSIIPPGGVDLLKNSSVIAVRIPVEAMGGAGLMMINVDTFNSRETEDDWLDRTVWRRIEL